MPFYWFLEGILLSQVTIYTDGAALGNPGPGGYGAVLISNRQQIEISCGFKLTTNNRMELLAVIMALKKLKKPCKVTLYSDSKYVCEAINQNWINGWIRRGWTKVKNIDLWKTLIPLLKTHQVQFIWVKGHAGNPGNERCDYLATTAAKTAAIETDHGYQASIDPNSNSLF